MILISKKNFERNTTRSLHLCQRHIAIFVAIVSQRVTPWLEEICGMLLARVAERAKL